MIVHRKEIKKKQNARTKKTYFFHERSFLHKTFSKIASIGPHKKDMKK